MSRTFEPIHPSISEIKSYKEKASFCDAYRFLDIKVLIKSDSHELQEYFKQTYRHFLVDTLWDGDEAHSFHVLTDGARPRGPLLLKDEDRVFTLLAGKALPDSADALIFGSVLSRIESHFMIHGAAVSSHGRGLVLSGLSGSGKSTLALELTRRGFMFCSDEIAAFSRATHRIHPFPRAIGTRENSLKLLENIDFNPGKLRHTVGGDKKWSVDIEDIFDDSLSGECEGKYLLLLDTAPESGGKATKDYHIVDIALKAADRNLIKRLDEIDGIDYLSTRFDDKYHTATVKVRKEKSVQVRFLETCEDFDDLILYKFKTMEKPPGPQQEPRLSPISRMDAALELLGNVQNLSVSNGWTLETSSVNISQILLELVDVIGGMECYRLLVGNLKKTSDLIFDQLIHA